MESRRVAVKPVNVSPRGGFVWRDLERMGGDLAHRRVVAVGLDSSAGVAQRSARFPRLGQTRMSARTARVVSPTAGRLARGANLSPLSRRARRGFRRLPSRRRSLRALLGTGGWRHSFNPGREARLCLRLSVAISLSRRLAVSPSRRLAQAQDFSLFTTSMISSSVRMCDDVLARLRMAATKLSLGSIPRLRSQ